MIQLAILLAPCTICTLLDADADTSFGWFFASIIALIAYNHTF